MKQRAWRWNEGVVDRSQPHFELRCGSAENAGWSDWEPVALVGPAVGDAFTVQFLIDQSASLGSLNLMTETRRELDFYLIELQEPDPWAYARYHCGTAANIYSAIHWSYFAGSESRGEPRRRRPVNLFWETRRLTQAREDHLTCFLAAALECDASFRSGYEHCVLAQLAVGASAPTIVDVETQPEFAESGCRPDLRLWLSDGRVVLCEHKLEAPEGIQVDDDGEIKRQLSRYLALPVDGVAYFRGSLTSAAAQYVGLSESHADSKYRARYLHPSSSAHFLWRDLHGPLSNGRHEITRWLLDGFRRLGFTPPVPHIGDLWPDDSEQVREHQRNFGKLWHRTKAFASTHWDITTGRRCELYLRRRSPGDLVARVYISPIAQDGTLLRFRVTTGPTQRDEVLRRLSLPADVLPVEPEVVVGTLRGGGDAFVDVLTPLYLLLAASGSSEHHEKMLFRQVSPMLAALL